MLSIVSYYMCLYKLTVHTCKTMWASPKRKTENKIENPWGFAGGEIEIDILLAPKL